MLYSLTMNAIQSAVSRFEGGQVALARLLDVSPQNVNQWVMGKRPVPEKHCPAIEAATGIRCEVIRPDVTWTRDQAGQVTGYHVPLLQAS